MPRARTVLAALFACVLLDQGARAGDTPSEPVAAWSVRGDFAKDDEARTNLSGAACTTKSAPFRSCLIVNDQKNYAQFFSIDGTRLSPGAVVRLREGGGGDPDLEGAAYARGFFYAHWSPGGGRRG